METTVTQLYRQISDTMVYCFNVESPRPLSEEDTNQLKLLFADGFIQSTVQTKPIFKGDRVVEVGPRLNFATAWSSNMVSICRAIGLHTITRVERSRRHLVPADLSVTLFKDRTYRAEVQAMRKGESYGSLT